MKTGNDGIEESSSNVVPFELRHASNFSQSASLVERYFTKSGRRPFKYNMYGDLVNWVSEDVAVTDDMGKVVFTQKGVAKPDFWSTLALKVVASKYFWGDQAKGEREDSIEKIIGRVGRFIE